MQQNNACETAYQCTTLLLNDGLRGDIATALGSNFGEIFLPAGKYTGVFPQKVSELRKTQAVWLLALVFYVVWQFMLVGIVTGQIVDAFSVMRSEETSLRADEEQVCLVCSVDRFTLDHKAV